MDEHAAEFRLRRETQRRVCMNCGKEEETTWGGEEFYCAECRAKRARRVRVCDNCGKEEETTWDKDFFYCSECRAKYRAAEAAKAAKAAEPVAIEGEGTPTLRVSLSPTPKAAPRAPRRAASEETAPTEA